MGYVTPTQAQSGEEKILISAENFAESLKVAQVRAKLLSFNSYARTETLRTGTWCGGGEGTLGGPPTITATLMTLRTNSQAIQPHSRAEAAAATTAPSFISYALLGNFAGPLKHRSTSATSAPFIAACLP